MKRYVLLLTPLLILYTLRRTPLQSLRFERWPSCVFGEPQQRHSSDGEFDSPPSKDIGVEEWYKNNEPDSEIVVW